MILGAMLSPGHLILILSIIVFVIVIPIILFSSRAKHKAKAETLDKVLRNQKNADDKFERIEKLNNLKNAGGLTEEEFEKEKKKILG